LPLANPVAEDLAANEVLKDIADDRCSEQGTRENESLRGALDCGKVSLVCLGEQPDCADACEGKYPHLLASPCRDASVFRDEQVGFGERSGGQGLRCWRGS